MIKRKTARSAGVATIRDVARESGVSVATVSYVLNNGPRNVAAPTRERVLDTVRRLNYHPNATAQRLAGRKMRTVGVLFGYVETEILTNPYAAMVVQGILSAAAQQRYNVTLFTLRWEDADTSAAEFRDERTDGILVVAPLTNSDIVQGLADLQIPLVTVSSPSGVPGVPYVDVDNTAGARMATEHLLALGHTRFAHIGGQEVHQDVPARRNAFLQTLAEAGIMVPDTYLPEGTYDWQLVRKIARQILTLPEPPTAIFAGNDTLALVILEVAQSLGLRVPEDLSLVGFDDLPMAAVVSPGLTTVRQPLIAIGAAATRTLIREIEGDAVENEERQDIVMSPELIVRGSTGPPAVR